MEATRKQPYEAPSFEALELKAEGTLCTSDYTRHLKIEGEYILPDPIDPELETFGRDSYGNIITF